MSNQVDSLKKGLTVKDLVTTGIFSAISVSYTHLTLPTTA